MIWTVKDSNIITAIKMVQSIQSQCVHLLWSAIDQLDSILDSNILAIVQDAHSRLRNIVNTIEKSNSVGIRAIHKSEYHQDINIYVLIQFDQYFSSYTSNEILYHNNPSAEALMKNLANPCINEIYSVNKDNIDVSIYPFGNKLKYAQIGNDMTFKYAFEFASQYIPTNNSVIILGMYY